MASGRQTVCLESMNQLLPAARLEHEVAPAHRVGQQVVAQRLGGPVSGRRARASSDHRTAPRRADLADHRARRPRPRQRRQHGVDRRRASTASTMPRPRLNTRAISSGSTGPSRAISAKIARRLPRAAVRPRRRSPAGRTRARLPAMPPPVMWAARVHPRRSRRQGGQHGRGVDDRRAGAARRPASGVGPGPRRAVEVAAGPFEQHVAGQACSRWSAARARPGPPARPRGAPGRAPARRRPRPRRRRSRRGRGRRRPWPRGARPSRRRAARSRPGGSPRPRPPPPAATCVGDEPAHGQVVEEEQRLGPGADQVVDAHGHQVDADRVVAAGGPGHQQLGAHAVGRGHEHRAGG